MKPGIRHPLQRKGIKYNIFRNGEAFSSLVDPVDLFKVIPGGAKLERATNRKAPIKLLDGKIHVKAVGATQLYRCCDGSTLEVVEVLPDSIL